MVTSTPRAMTAAALNLTSDLCPCCLRTRSHLILRSSCLCLYHCLHRISIKNHCRSSTATTMINLARSIVRRLSIVQAADPILSLEKRRALIHSGWPNNMDRGVPAFRALLVRSLYWIYISAFLPLISPILALYSLTHTKNDASPSSHILPPALAG